MPDDPLAPIQEDRDRDHGDPDRERDHGDPDRDRQDRADSLRRWKRRVAQAVKTREQWERDFKVETLERYFLGQQGDSETVFNHFWGTIRDTRPALFYTAPKFFIRSEPGRAAPASDAFARAAEGVLEAISRRDHNLKLSGKLAVLQAYFRLGVLKVIYDPRMEPNPIAGQPIWQADESGQPILTEFG